MPDVADFERRVTKRVAYATRYGKIGLWEALGSEIRWLVLFNDVLGEIVREENKPRGA